MPTAVGLVLYQGIYFRFYGHYFAVFTTFEIGIKALQSGRAQGYINA
ncbi:hypothetical protein ACROAE_09495 [Shewanella sp. MF05960]